MRQPDLRRLFIAYAVTYSGTAMAPIAMAFGVLALTGSARATSIVIAAPTLASIAILLIGGVLADRTSRKRLIVIAELLSMLVQLAIAGLFLSESATVPVLTILMLFNGVAMSLNAPAALGLIIEIVDREDLQAANALISTARNAALVVGAALGGILVSAFGAGVAILIDGVSFGISALLVASLNPRRQTPLGNASFLQDLRLGWREFTSHTWLWVIVVQFSLVVAVWESVFGLLGPAVARDHMDGARDWGFIAASFGVGTLLGGLLSLKLKARYPMRFATFCTFAFCVLPLALAVPLPMPVVALAAIAQGVAGQIFVVLWNTTLQTKVPAQMLSRVSAYDHLGSIALAPLGIVAAGLLFEWLGFRATLLIAASTFVITTLVALCVRDVRMLTRSD